VIGEAGAPGVIDAGASAASAGELAPPSAARARDGARATSEISAVASATAVRRGRGCMRAAYAPYPNGSLT
jgi:hypothetical protein